MEFIYKKTLFVIGTIILLAPLLIGVNLTSQGQFYLLYALIIAIYYLVMWRISVLQQNLISALNEIDPVDAQGNSIKKD